MRPIDADAAKKLICSGCELGFCDICRRKMLLDAIDALPTIEPKRGKWKEDIGGFSCTVCGYHTDDDEIGNWDITFGRWKYCPSCGAMMRERSKDGEIR